MIEVIGISEPDSDHVTVCDMYIAPEDGQLAFDALGYAEHAAKEWVEGVQAAARLYEPGTRLADTAPMRRRENVYRGTALDVFEITSDGNVAHVPDAQLVYEGMMYGFGLKARHEGIAHHGLTIVLASFGFGRDSWLMGRLQAGARAAELDAYLDKVRHQVMTPELYEISRRAAPIVRAGAISTAIY